MNKNNLFLGKGSVIGLVQRTLLFHIFFFHWFSPVSPRLIWHSMTEALMILRVSRDNNSWLSSKKGFPISSTIDTKDRTIVMKVVLCVMTLIMMRAFLACWDSYGTFKFMHYAGHFRTSKHPSSESSGIFRQPHWPIYEGIVRVWLALRHASALPDVATPPCTSADVHLDPSSRSPITLWSTKRDSFNSVCHLFVHSSCLCYNVNIDYMKCFLLYFQIELHYIA